MTARRVHILGGSNAGKSTISRRLSEEFALPVFELDDLHWDNSQGYIGKRRDPDEKQQMLERLLERDEWIFEGVYYRWLAAAFERADLIVILDVPRRVRQARMLRRFIRGKLGREPDQEDGVRSLWQTFSWNHQYDRNYLPATREFIAGLGRTWVDCRTYEEARAAVEATAASK